MVNWPAPPNDKDAKDELQDTVDQGSLVHSTFVHEGADHGPNSWEDDVDNEQK